MGKYLDLIRQVEESHNSASFGEIASNDANPNKRVEGYELNEINELNNPICLFCRQPVERGTPGTGALAGDDLHLNCFQEEARAAGTKRPTCLSPRKRP